MGYLTNDSSPADILADDLGNRLTDDILIPTVADRVLDFGLACSPTRQIKSTSAATSR